jgi:hypothetical protein
VEILRFQAECWSIVLLLGILVADLVQAGKNQTYEILLKNKEYFSQYDIM